MKALTLKQRRLFSGAEADCSDGPFGSFEFGFDYTGKGVWSVVMAVCSIESLVVEQVVSQFRPALFPSTGPPDETEYGGGVGEDASLFVSGLVNPVDLDFGNQSIDGTGKSAPAVVAFDGRFANVRFPEHIGDQRFCNLHGLLCVESVEYVDEPFGIHGVA